LQERLEILPAALLPWRQSRSYLSAEAKARTRAEHVEVLAETGKIPGWALGTEALPGYVELFLDQILTLKRMQALELLQLVKDELLKQSTRHGETGQACLMTCQFIYGENNDGWKKAKELLSKIVGADRAKCIAALQKREEYIRQHAVDDETLKKSLMEGPRTTRRTPNTRSRSRSPVAANRGRGRGRGRGARRPSPANRPSSNANNAPPGRGRSQGKRSRSNDRTVQFSRDNNHSRARSPQGGPDVRSTNSLWNDNRQAPQSRRPFKLSSEEQAIIKALRQNKQ
jgi:hypothetical protein